MPGSSRRDFLSESWFGEARALFGELPRRPGVSWRLQFDAADSGRSDRWFQVVEDGQLAAWQRGELDAPDLELRWALTEARAVHRGERSGTDAMAALRVVGADGVETAAPPVNIGDTGKLSELPMIPGATLRVQYEFAHGPFGTVAAWMSFVDGQSTGIGFGRVEEPDIALHISYQKMVAVCTDQLSIWEALEGGELDGAVGPIMLLSALEESDELHDAERACGPPGSVLAKVGELASTAEHREARKALAALTE